jgi:hypothetical protein
LSIATAFYSRQKKPLCRAKRLRPEPKAKEGDALGQMKQEKNKNNVRKFIPPQMTFLGFAMRRDCSVTRDLLTKSFIARKTQK